MKNRSRKYQEAKKLIDKSKLYSAEEGLELLKKLARKNFDEAVEVHLKLGLDKKLKQVVRGTAALPFGTGKKLRICVFTTQEKQKEAKDSGADLVGAEELIREIKTTKKADFDVAIASPEMMKNLGQVAKLLGQKGLMPNPKDETINADPAKVVRELRKGKITFKSDESGNLHQVIGRVSFESKKLLDNYKVLIDTISKSKQKDAKGRLIESITLCSSMGPGIRVKV